MKKRSTTTLVAGGLLAAMLPGVAAAQTEGQVALSFAIDTTCEFGQVSTAPLPACDLDESSGIMTIKASNPAHSTGAFEGVQVLRGSVALDTATGMYESTGTAFFSGAVEGCGVGTIYFDYLGTGALNEAGLPGGRDGHLYGCAWRHVSRHGQLRVDRHRDPERRRDDATNAASAARSMLAVVSGPSFTQGRRQRPARQSLGGCDGNVGAVSWANQHLPSSSRFIDSG